MSIDCDELMHNSELLAAWRAEEQAHFTGWDFSYLDGRMIEEMPATRYKQRTIELLQQSQAVLDLDTGGGERLLELQPYWPARVAASEGYPPNLQLATERLGPLGVEVVALDSSELVQLPFEPAVFDLVLNRHGGCLPMAEIARVLRPGGTLLTQQVHGQTLLDLLTHFGATPQWPDATPAYYVPRIQAAGLELIDLHEYTGAEIFHDVGAIVYFLKAIPWLVPGFSVDRYATELLALQHRLEAGQQLRFATSGYLIEARKPNALDHGQ